MENILQYLGRSSEMLDDDLHAHHQRLTSLLGHSSCLVLGAAGSIGQAVTRLLMRYAPAKLHLVDISENNLVELVRDLRSCYQHFPANFQALALDIGSVAYDRFISSDGKYDYVLNLSALKHVRSEKDVFTLMRMIDVNILNTEKTIRQSIQSGVKKYFCVSTDKASNPVNMMGASKRIMELVLLSYSDKINISSARFANVAFSDGSLLHGFRQRLHKRQPLAAPSDIRRYFITDHEAAVLCIMSCCFGQNRDVYFPKLNESQLISMTDIAEKFLKNHGYNPKLCSTEQEARTLMATLPEQGLWPCVFSTSDTTGEKEAEEFYEQQDQPDFQSYQQIGVLHQQLQDHQQKLAQFSEQIQQIKAQAVWHKADIVKLFMATLPGFDHMETGKYLDGKM
ncbi:UDP-N-acetylglucosamine 4,6-dehydratase [Rheinheimera sp.]|uniref:UDP-N-acetylglucosamine 4,6-dehydratase n=1 Tax=Rheinheimera sp. TaxID=1869214 RepID=UPI0027B900CB|nr:UDP-N-acetylglucosamine 4,6-dehydratase [Rheinheimera sp.]